MELQARKSVMTTKMEVEYLEVAKKKNKKKKK